MVDSAINNPTIADAINLVLRFIKSNFYHLENEINNIYVWFDPLSNDIVIKPDTIPDSDQWYEHVLKLITLVGSKYPEFGIVFHKGTEIENELYPMPEDYYQIILGKFPYELTRHFKDINYDMHESLNASEYEYNSQHNDLIKAA